MVTELQYRLDIGVSNEFEAGENISLEIPEDQRDRERRLKVDRWRKDLIGRIKLIEERSREEKLVGGRAASSEAKYRFIELVKENWSKKALREENYADFFLKCPSRNQHDCVPAVKALMRLLDTAEETRALQIVQAELYRYCRISVLRTGVQELSVRDLEQVFTKSLCNQLRAMERGQTQLNLREIVLLSKFLSEVHNDRYILGGKKALEDVTNFKIAEKKVEEEAAFEKFNSKTALPADKFVESVRAKGGWDRGDDDQDQAVDKGNDTPDVPGPCSEEVFTQDIQVQVAGQRPILVEKGQILVKTPVKSKPRLMKPNIDIKMELQMISQMAMLTDPLEDNTLQKAKRGVMKIYQEKVQTVFHGKEIEFRWCDHYLVATLIEKWWRRCKLGKLEKSLREILIDIILEKTKEGVKLDDISEVRENIENIVNRIQEKNR